MDRELARLKRELELAPESERAARHYEQALERAGQRDELEGRYRFKFLCSYRFEDLDETLEPNVRFCRDCQRDVHYVTDLAQLGQRVAAGECVAFRECQLGSAFQGLVEHPRTHSASQETSPCVVEGEPAELPVRPPMMGAVEYVPPPSEIESTPESW